MEEKRSTANEDEHAEPYTPLYEEKSADSAWFPEHEVSFLIGYRTKTSASVFTMLSATTHVGKFH